MWTKDQVRKHQRALATADKWDEPIRALEQLAKHSPAFADRIAELRVRRDNLAQLASVAIQIDAKGD